MEVPSSGIKKACDGDGDRISSLPQNLMEHILTFLPLREAVKTSILSTAWRHKWVYRPSLVFDNHFWTPPLQVFETSVQFYRGGYVNVPNTIDRFVLNVFRVLCYHRGPLREFSLSIPHLRSYPAQVDQILLSLHEKCIEKLCIEIDGYKLPSHLFWFRQLKKLKLVACVFKSSRVSFDEFSMLTCLDLRSVKFPDVAGVSLAIRCPLLLALTMVDCGSDLNRLDIVIEAPSLGLFHCVGRFSSLCVKEAPLLKDVTVHKIAGSVDHSKSKDDEPTNFVKLCGGCPAVERLSLALGLFIDLSPPVFLSLTTPLAKLMMLRQLRLDGLCLGCASDVWICLSLIEHSPNLQELIIGTRIKANLNIDQEWRIIQWQCDRWTYIPRKLEKVELNQLQGLRTEMWFVQCLLSSLPVLDKMKMKFSTSSLSSDQFRTLKELNRFQRLSKKAQVIIE